MTFYDFALAMTLSDGAQTYHLVFKLSPDVNLRLPADERSGHIAAEYCEPDGTRRFRALTDDMSFAAAKSLVSPFLAEFWSGDPNHHIALDSVAEYLASV